MLCLLLPFVFSFPANHNSYTGLDYRFMPQWLNWIWESRFYMMDDVISLSSGSEEDSDIEFVSSYRDDSAKGIPFIRAELLPVTPVSLNLPL